MSKSKNTRRISSKIRRNNNYTKSKTKIQTKRKNLKRRKRKNRNKRSRKHQKEDTNLTKRCYPRSNNS